MLSLAINKKKIFEGGMKPGASRVEMKSSQWAFNIKSGVQTTPVTICSGLLQPVSEGPAALSSRLAQWGVSALQ